MKTERHTTTHLTRRDFLRRSAGLAGAGAALAPVFSVGAANASNSKPNILFLMTDQQTASAMRCAGNPYLHTPAMDALAAQGVRFEHAYVPQPLCTPSRTCMQTGRYPHETGVISNGLSVTDKAPMLGTLMSAAGYTNTYIGKWHVGADFEEAGYTGMASDFRPDHKKTEAAVDFLKRNQPTPFFLTVSFMNPHNVCQLARGQELPDGPIGVPPSELEALPPLPHNFAIPDHEPAAIRTVQQRIPYHYPTRDWDALHWRQYLWGYHRLIEKVDAEIGRVLNALYASPYAQNTLIIFVSDHGEGIAMHHWNQKQVLYDQCTKVPMILAGPDVVSQHVSRELVSTALDIPQTLLDYAGATPPQFMHGLSLRKLITEGAAPLNRGYVVAETKFARGVEPLGLRGRMIRTPRYKYCVYDRGENREQLFDMHADPGEMHNLAVQAAHQQTLVQGRQTLRQWATETADTTFPYVKA